LGLDSIGRAVLELNRDVDDAAAVGDEVRHVENPGAVKRHGGIAIEQGIVRRGGDDPAAERADVNLEGRRLRIAAAKTDAGVREVDLTPALQALLTEYRRRSTYAKPGDLVFPTREGKRDNPSNVRNRFLDSAAKVASADLRAAQRGPMPDLTPHSLHRTFISLLLAAGTDVPYVMAQAGHTDPKMTLGLYAQVIASKTDHGAALDGIIAAAA
jgi:integrase